MMHSGFNPDHLPPGIVVETTGTIVPVDDAEILRRLQEITPSTAVQLEIARKHPPPQEWLDEPQERPW